ncbi:helix-turn-helix domain-containing protein [Christensenellaceae bacterium OttesenSCG-928-K19]|nr:helix-turn-helix domain-containing protein [Christensenellaceae bacterium OttesenSCG-928-K19]
MIKTKFGNRIRDLRKQKELSQEKFALLIDMDRTYYASVENGKRNISLENIAKIAKGLGISLETLFKNI